ncbi:hypothetical protein ABH927_004887 [Planotetraspora sp. GP83]
MTQRPVLTATHDVTNGAQRQVTKYGKSVTFMLLHI